MGLLGLGAGVSAFAQSSTSARDAETGPDELLSQRLSRPAVDSDEGGLWSMMDREETRLRRSPFLLRDKSLVHYVNEVVGKLAGGHFADIRVYLVRTPWFNASMAPNGMMQVWTGLLLRVENEAQLAAVLGHEIGHYLERHSLERLRDAKSRAAFAQFMGLFGAVGAIGQIGALAGAFSFSREHETRADSLGMRLIQRAGYDGRQASYVWGNLLDELKITQGQDAGKRSPMMATHPPVETRRDDLLRLAGDKAGQTGAQAFQLATASHRFAWLQDEIRRGQYEESLVLFDRLIHGNPVESQLYYSRGEVLRLRAGPEDDEKALMDLNKAAQLERPPAATYRSMGLLYKQRSDPAAAARSFEKYLQTAPDAADSGLIQQYILELKS